MKQNEKEEFFQELQEIVEDRIYITASEAELSKEIRENTWSIGPISNQALAASISSHEVKAFLHQVKQDRQLQLQESNIKVNLIYYLWYDSLAGQLRFNFINHSHTFLPFRAKIELTKLKKKLLTSF